MPANKLTSVLLAVLCCTAHVGGKPVGERGGYTIATLTHIGGDHPPALPVVHGTEQQVHSLVSAGNGGGDLDCLVSDRAGVGGITPGSL